MVPSGNRWANGIAVRAPVILLVLAATVIPVEWRPQGHNALDFNIEAFDVLANVAAYMVVGFVLGDLGWQKAILIAAVMSTFAESIQLVMMHRDPSAIDLTSNVIGAILGTVMSARWRIRAISFGINRLRAMAAATLAVALVFGVSKTSGDRLSDHGAGSPGMLEAYWRLDESGGRVAEDSSGHGLNGKFSHALVRAAGAIGSAAKFDGETDYIDFGHSTAFRLVGSMTVSAWIKSTSYPIDDAAIVSSFHHSSGPFGSDARGFQLDTTVDNGPRTVGFKLANVCGNIVARYGATPLRLDTWYHVAGVYDAEEQTMTSVLEWETGQRRPARVRDGRAPQLTRAPLRRPTARLERVRVRRAHRRGAYLLGCPDGGGDSRSDAGWRCCCGAACADNGRRQPPRRVAQTGSLRCLHMGVRSRRRADPWHRGDVRCPARGCLRRLLAISSPNALPRRQLFRWIVSLPLRSLYAALVEPVDVFTDKSRGRRFCCGVRPPWVWVNGGIAV